MVTKSKLKLALAAEKGIDFKKIKEKRKVKAALKEKEKKAKSRTSGRGAAPPAPAAKEEEEDEEEEDEWEDEDEEEDDDDELETGNGLLDLEAEESSDEDDEDDEDRLDFGALEDSDSSDSEVEMEEKVTRSKKPASEKASGGGDQKTKDKKSNSSKETTTIAASKGDDDDGEEEDDEEEEDEDIPMSDLEDLPEEEKDDLIRHQRLTINNTTALLASLKRIALDTTSSRATFASHMSVVSSAPTEDSIPDVSDDLSRELALYSQSLEAAKKARALLRAEKVPFSRPGDYFAEMVKADDHMEKVKAKLVEDATAKKAAAEARKLRDLKKFGKQVQVAKMQERAKAKKDTLEKIKSLKRKRQESSAELPAREADLFDVAVDRELKSHSKAGGNNSKGGNSSSDRSRANKRQKKDQKFGFGGRKRNSKSGDAMSAGDLSGFSAGRMKGKSFGGGGGGGKTPRLGKSKRMAAKGRR